MSCRVGVLVSGDGSNLQAILDSVHGRGGVEVVCVAASRTAARAVERARRAGVAAEVFSVSDHPDRDARDHALAAWLESHAVDLVVLAGFMELLGAAFIRRFAGRIINVHPSLLPAFAGLRAIERAVEHGVKVLGVTVHFVDEGIDSGPIVLQEVLPLPYPRPIEAIEASIHAIEHRLLPRAIELIAAGVVRLDPAQPRVVLIDEERRGRD